MPGRKVRYREQREREREREKERERERNMTRWKGTLGRAVSVRPL
jgi:hypothetical protein